MRRIICVSLVLAAVCLPLTACNNLQPVMAPSFEIPISNNSKVEQAIRTALTNRGWAISKVTPNSVEASYRKVGGATAAIAVDHHGGGISIRYLDSSGLDYTPIEGSGMIHKTYNNWMASLEREILFTAGKML